MWGVVIQNCSLKGLPGRFCHSCTLLILMGLTNIISRLGARILTPDKRFNPLKYETSDVRSSCREKNIYYYTMFTIRKT